MICRRNLRVFKTLWIYSGEKKYKSSKYILYYTEIVFFMRSFPSPDICEKDHFISPYSVVHDCQSLAMRSFLAFAWLSDLRHQPFHNSHLLTS